MCLVQSLGESDTRVSGSVFGSLIPVRLVPSVRVSSPWVWFRLWESLMPMCVVQALGESDTHVSGSVFGRV